jgi:hypothetical protein
LSSTASTSRIHHLARRMRNPGLGLSRDP